MGEGHQDRLLDHQRDGRDHRYQAVFREAFRRRRCLVPVEAYYEWQKLDAKTKQPYAFALAEGSFMALAGLWETWKSPAGEWCAASRSRRRRRTRLPPRP